MIFVSWEWLTANYSHVIKKLISKSIKARWRSAEQCQTEEHYTVNGVPWTSCWDYPRRMVGPLSPVGSPPRTKDSLSQCTLQTEGVTVCTGRGIPEEADLGITSKLVWGILKELWECVRHGRMFSGDWKWDRELSRWIRKEKAGQNRE